MSETPDIPEPAAEPEQHQTSRIGVDSWVAESEGRRTRTPAILLGQGWNATPDLLKLLGFLAIAASLPFWVLENGGNLFNFGLYTLIYAGLALGLNAIVGLSGLLDLGYVAYFGIGAYMYAELSSGFYGIHWPAEATIPIAMAAAAIAGLALGISSRRLLGDYFAIVTLFFAEAFYAFTNNANPTVGRQGLTGGSNGIPQLDKLRFSIAGHGYTFSSTKQLYYLLLVIVGLIAASLYLVNQSRTGRAWRASREDPLAAEAMSVPINRVKITAVVFGAAVAGLMGTVYAAMLTAVTPTYFSVGVLILLYTIVILGGFGSIAGVFLGAIFVNVGFQFLLPQTPYPSFKRWLFYGLLIFIVLRLKPWYRGVLVVAGTIAFGFAVHVIVAASASRFWTSGAPLSGSPWLRHWVVIPQIADSSFNSVAYIGLVVAACAVVSLKGWWRSLTLVPTLYLAAIAWENLLSSNPGVTAGILFGLSLVGLMAVRPQGLLGSARVEIV